ncbi:head-tail connector protein [Pusillimonas sp. ANT_WB101]|uniref:head-tail connector protein n=1 Tax=Pusillimonas sp. ANT_WB101 TaxID=2597356 RepID=UPI0011EBF777|nr:head-tail connector protein [Pusillimonas sp. ANT_WB101]KAA0893076.1 phage gp6-like head-tail connector protein [Pusillimonas sp. ANT_WB101]
MITLDQAKMHLRVIHDDEDTAISAMIAAATMAAADYLNLDEMPDPMPAPVQAAILLQVADLYENRERQADKPFHGNPTYFLLLNPYKVMEV